MILSYFRNFPCYRSKWKTFITAACTETHSRKSNRKVISLGIFWMSLYIHDCQRVTDLDFSEYQNRITMLFVQLDSSFPMSGIFSRMRVILSICPYICLNCQTGPVIIVSRRGVGTIMPGPMGHWPGSPGLRAPGGPQVAGPRARVPGH